MAGCFQSFVHRLTRRKFLDISTVSETKLKRCLSTLDLTALGVGSTLGAGIYIVAGQVARETAGPAVILSFLIAAVASIFAGLCYAEFGARVPKTGSAYVYSYITVGEFWAFIIGWNLILEYVIGTASVARAWSEYLDKTIGGYISNFFKEHMVMYYSGKTAVYPDFFALGITLILTVILAIGVKESSLVNNIFTGVNLLVVAYVIICGIFKADIHNWELSPDEIPKVANETNGDGGFFPFGVSGMLSGAATCFYAFVGFDCIATTGEEVRNPQKAIPLAIIGSLLLCFAAYAGISAILTLMVPYYAISEQAPVPQVFHDVGWDVAKYIIAVGAICGLSTSLLGAMFPMPRVIYAMASDGLLFRFLSRVNDKFLTPFAATILSGVLAGIMALMFDLNSLVEMMSIGTLLAYTLVAACVLILRYDSIGESNDDASQLLETGKTSPFSLLRELFKPSIHEATQHSSKIVKYCVCAMAVVVVVLSLTLALASKAVGNGVWWAVTLVAVFGTLYLLLIIIIYCQPQNRDYVTFKVPVIPITASVSIFINIYLMMKLNYLTWIRFGVWNCVGWIIYFAYGMWHSSEEARDLGALEPDTAPPTDPVPSSPPALTEDSSLIQ